MSAFDEAVAACKASSARMPPHLAAWLVAREAEEGHSDQPALGQALIDLMGSPGPEPLASIVTRMVHPNVEHRFPVDGKELREALYGFVSHSGRPAGPPQVNMFLSSLPKPRESGEWQTRGPQLDASGRLSDRVQAQGANAPPPEVFEPPKLSDDELQLARAPRKPQKEWVETGPYRNEPPKSRVNAALISVIVLGVLALGAVGAFMMFPTLQRKLPIPVAPAKALLVTSTPEGATVLVEGQSVGTTPYAGDNRWRGKVKLELRLDGFEPFRDSFEGGKDQSIGATLKKKK